MNWKVRMLLVVCLLPCSPVVYDTENPDIHLSRSDYAAIITGSLGGMKSDLMIQSIRKDLAEHWVISASLSGLV